jgi:hypothetical protein
MVRDILIGGAVFVIVVSIVFLTGMRDESIQPNRFDCRMLIGGWHPDVSPQIAEHCRKGVKNDNSSKTSYR